MLRTHALPVTLLDDLLSAFIQDVQKTRDAQGYADRAELLDRSQERREGAERRSRGAAEH